MRWRRSLVISLFRVERYLPKSLAFWSPMAIFITVDLMQFVYNLYLLIAPILLVFLGFLAAVVDVLCVCTNLSIHLEWLCKDTQYANERPDQIHDEVCRTNILCVHEIRPYIAVYAKRRVNLQKKKTLADHVNLFVKANARNDKSTTSCSVLCIFDAVLCCAFAYDTLCCRRRFVNVAGGVVHSWFRIQLAHKNGSCQKPHKRWRNANE